MTSTAQQIALDNALVALENRSGIGKCNMRINPGMKPKEPTYQVVLDALALTTCYPAFLITAVFKEILNIDPQGVILKDQNNINRLMRTNELHKFSDGTLNSVRTALHDITSRIRMEYLPKRK
ncbi:hypothetical protein Tco_0868004 [Tanacetum coccineum]